ncbi:MAG TPA: glucosamine-6-phosphate deaminase [Hanamia sp.]
MKIFVEKDKDELGKASGKLAAKFIKNAILKNGVANIILATGNSQNATLKQLVEEDIDWDKVVMFHLDEYVGLPESHSASFRKYLKRKFLEEVSTLKASYLINGEIDPLIECKRLNNIIENYPIDVALVGIGENGHLAFNDPPADFVTKQPYIIVSLNEKCKQQQVSEGWFQSIDKVPERAISMSINQILKSEYIICSVPDSRKATAVKNCVEHPVSNLFSASILQLHPNCSIFLDKLSSALLHIKDD